MAATRTAFLQAPARVTPARRSLQQGTKRHQQKAEEVAYAMPSGAAQPTWQSLRPNGLAASRPATGNRGLPSKALPLHRSNAMRSFLARFAGVVRGVLSGFDRLFLRG